MSQQDSPEITFSAVILAAGLSERMGQHKSLLKWDDATTFIEKIIREYLPLCKQVVCTVNPELYPVCLEMGMPSSVKFILNGHLEWGRLYSIKLGLEAAREAAYCFLQNVDNPFIHREILDKLLSAADPAAWCSPEFQGRGGHPVLLPGLIISKILENFNPEQTLREALVPFPKKVVVMDDDSILRNINTAEEYRHFRASGLK